MLHLIRSGHGQPLQGAPAWPLRCSFCAFGVLCQDMIDAGLEADVSPKGSRRPVDRRWVSDVPPPSQTFMGIACHGMSRHVHRTSRGDLPAGPAGCRHRAAGLGAAASEDGMQTALQTCGARDGPANLGDGPELLEPARRTVHFCGWPVSHRGSRQAWQWTQVQPGLPRVLLRRVCLRPHSDSFSFKCFVFRLLFTKAEVYIYIALHILIVKTEARCTARA